MAQTFQELLVGRKIYSGRIVPPDFKEKEAIEINKFLRKQRCGELFEITLSFSKEPFLLKVPAHPLKNTHKYVQKEIDTLQLLAKLESFHIPQIELSFLLGAGKKLPLFYTNFFEPYSICFPELVNKKPAPHTDVLATFYILAQTLEQIAKKNIVHGNLQPDNIQFHKKMPVIAHWITAKKLEESGIASLYSPLWLPPEVLSEAFVDPGKMDHKTDVWSWGLSFMYFLTGISLSDYISIEGEDEKQLDYLLKHSHKKVISGYRNHCKNILHKHYLADTYLQKQKLFNDISSLCQSATKASFDADKKLVERFELDHLVANCEKLLTAPDKKEEAKQLYFEILLTVFDICTQTRIRPTAEDLVKVIHGLFPSIAEFAKPLVHRPPAVFEASFETSRPKPKKQPEKAFGGFESHRHGFKKSADSYIVCSPFPPFKLSRTDFTIGRENDNSLCIASADVSRYHAVVKWEKGNYVIADLKSANKTFVNDKVIDSHTLEEKDQIRIGNSNLTFQKMDAHKPSPKITQSTIASSSIINVGNYLQNLEKFKASLQGDIKTMGLFSVLQMISADQQSGVMNLVDGEKTASINFLKGSIVHADYGELKAKDAFWEIARWKEGSFLFAPSENIKEVSMCEKVESLLLEVACFLDEEQRDS